MTKHGEASRTAGLGDRRWQIFAVVGVLVLVVVVLALKPSAPSATASVTGTESVQPTQVSEASTTVTDDSALAAAEGELPQAHLERLLDMGVPILAFFHSTTCAQCVEMTGIVDQVYPDFETQVALVDVDVYDDLNQTLLQAAGIRVIPTLIFFDGEGTAQGSTGVMPAEQLRTVLTDLTLESTREP